MQRLSQNSLQRRLKRRLLSEPHVFFAVCQPGFESVLAEEVTALPEVAKLSRTHGGVSFEGPLDLVYYSNLHLNSAHRILLRIREFSAQTFQMLASQLGRVEWELWVPANAFFSVRATARQSQLNMKKRLERTVADAIVKRLRTLGEDATFEQSATLEFRLRLEKNRAYLSLNSSGEHLHKRGYKVMTVPAPLRETIAAGILLAVNHAKYDLIVDPFAGSGTFLIEAARMATGHAPGQSREFGFMKAAFYNERKFARLREVKRTDTRTRYIGYDISESAVQAALANAKNIGLEDIISFEAREVTEVDFRSLGSTFDRKLLVSNPPYGERIQTESGERQELLHKMLKQLSGWKVALVTPVNDGLTQVIGKGTKWAEGQAEVLRFSNGGIPSQAIVFEVH